MKSLHRLLASMALAWVPASKAEPPASLANKVFHESVAATTIRGLWTYITEMKADGTAVRIKSSDASMIQPPYYGGHFLRVPRSDLTYSYTVTGSESATLTVLGAAGSNYAFTYYLHFTTPTEGRIVYGTQDLSGSFYLSESDNLSVAPALNLSVRGSVAPGRPLIAGFVVAGSVPRDVLIRAVGPSLSKLGVTGVWSDPDFGIFQDGAAVQSGDFHYSDWSKEPVGDPAPAFSRLFSYVGAFPLLDNSKDAAEVARLEPGAYTIVASPASGDPGGEVLLELYFLP